MTKKITRDRSYRQTHPWLNFQVDLGRADPSFWMQLGELVSKTRHVAGVAVRPSTAQEMMQVYLAKGVQATTAIEGNTLSESDVRAIMAGDLKLPPSQEYLKVEVDNIVRACGRIWSQQLGAESPALDLDHVCELNRSVLEGTKLREGVEPGCLREMSVTVGRYRPPHWRDCRFLLGRLCDWLEGDDFAAQSGLDVLAIATLKAILAHLYLAWIHPFGDGNGRTARLVEFSILVSAGAPMPVAHLLSNHYNATRNEYYAALHRCSQTGDPFPFMRYALVGFVDQIRAQVSRIEGEQLDIAWRNYVHERFSHRDGAKDPSKVQVRRRHLALDLSRMPNPVSVGSVDHISPQLARAYATKTPRTVARDVEALIGMGLLIRCDESGRSVEGGTVGAYVRAKVELMRGFMPPRVEQEPQS